MDFLDDKDDRLGDSRPFYSIQSKAFEEAFKKLPEEYQRIVVFAAIGKQTRYLAQQFSICCLLTSVRERRKMRRPLTLEERQFIASEEKLLAELYRDPHKKPS